MLKSQLVLNDATLRVATAVLPFGRVASEIARACDKADGGHLSTTEVRELVRALDLATRDPASLVTASALREAGEDLRQALISVDLDALELAHVRTVSVFVWDARRDGPVPSWLGRLADL